MRRSRVPKDFLTLCGGDKKLARLLWDSNIKLAQAAQQTMLTILEKAEEAFPLS